MGKKEPRNPGVGWEGEGASHDQFSSSLSPSALRMAEEEPRPLPSKGWAEMIRFPPERWGFLIPAAASWLPIGILDIAKRPEVFSQYE